MKKSTLVLVSIVLPFSLCNCTTRVSPEPKTKVIYIKSKCPKKPKFKLDMEALQPLKIDYEVK